MRTAWRAALLAILLLPVSLPAGTEFESAVAELERGAFATAIPTLRRLAEDGDPRAQDTLAGLYLEGIGVERDVDVLVAGAAAKGGRRAIQRGGRSSSAGHPRI